ncbi:hypothetical protein [Erwinia sp. S59]|uniref:hypothetical protein n=1 Tax=Erwinia sp. S59 TaxID=2769340 RepID=UPI00190AD44D|nr:hypothetical protein [Erwinia sp. S59]MBK0089729.1 hypothetical protein [Erwinia sp. S59]
MSWLKSGIKMSNISQLTCNPKGDGFLLFELRHILIKAQAWQLNQPLCCKAFLLATQ